MSAEEVRSSETVNHSSGDTLDSEKIISKETAENESSTEDITIESETVVDELNTSSETEIEKNSEDIETVVEEEIDEDEELVERSDIIAEEETVESEAVNEDDPSNSKCSRELKSLLELSKEANLDTNINHKRKSVDPKKLFNKNNLLDDHENEDANEDNMHDVQNLSGKRKSLGDKFTNNPKRLKKEPQLDLGLLKKNKDPFCWRCHKNVVSCQKNINVGIYCDTCPRSYHLKCVKQSGNPHWQCPECIKIMKAENVKTRSPSLKSMDLDHLCSLLKFALKRMMQVADSEPFLLPVNEKLCPDYKKYIIHPMDLSMLQKNIENSFYGSTNAFESDTKWILHNSIIYNSYQSKLTSTAKYIERICKQEMIEIENCSNCYLNANTKESWFVEVCPKPHLLIWAKLKGFPYWPAKAMSTNRFGMVDVRFFGAHDRAWVNHKDCYLYSQKNPNIHQMKKYNINECIMEVDIYIENLRKKFGVFKYAPFKAPFDPEVEHLTLFLPKYVPPNSNKRLKRSDSKSSISSTRSLSSVVKDLSKEMEIDDDEDPREHSKEESDSIELNDQEISKSENIEKSEQEEKINNNIEKIDELKSPNPEVKITDKLFKKLVTPEEKDTEKLDLEKKDPTEMKKSLEKQDYEENDLLEVLYAEDVDGSRLGSAKKEKKLKMNGVIAENTLISGMKDNISKALATTKNTKTSDTNTAKIKTLKENIEEKEDKIRVSPRKEDTKKESKKTKTKPETETKSKGMDISNDAVARGFGKIKAINEINKAINVIRPDLLLKNRKNSIDSKKNMKIRRSASKCDKSDDDLEIVDWYMHDTPDENEEVSRKRKLSVDSNEVNVKKQDQEEVILIKCDFQPLKTIKKSSIAIQKKVEDQANPTVPETPKLSTEKEASENANKRELFQALQISEKVTEPEKPKVHEIRTRSKTEEKHGGVTLKQRARKSFPNTKNHNIYKNKKDMPLPPLITTNRVLKQVTSSPLLGNNPSIVVSSGVSTTSTSQSLVLVPAPLLFQSTQLGGTNTGHVLAMVTPGNSPYTFVSQSSGFLNGNINLTLGNDKIQTSSTPKAIENKTESVASSITNITVGNPSTEIQKAPSVPIDHVASCDVALASETQNDPNDTSIANKGIVSEKAPIVLEKDNISNLPKGKLVDKQNFNSTVSEPLNSADFNVLNGIVNESIPKALSEILSRPPPSLKPRPPGPLSKQFDTGVPSSAGPWTARINSISHRLSDYFRGMLIETLNDISSSTENPDALITTLQLEIEALKSRHIEEILEIKKNVNSLLQDIQKSIIEEKEKIIAETRAVCETETIRRVEEAKSKQWCANCMKEAQFYCCWNTSYCDYPCQTKHWPKHMSKCTQNSQSQNSTQMGIMKGSQQIVLRPVMPPKGFTGGKPILAKPTKIIMSKAATTSVPMNIVRTSTPSGIALLESTPGNFEVITNGQIIDGSKIVNAPLNKGKPKTPVTTTTISTSSSTTHTNSKTIILQSAKSPVMSSTSKTQEKQSTQDPLAI